MKRFLFTPFILAFACINFSTKNNLKSHPGFETETESLDALAYLSQLASYPNAEISNGNYYTAFEKYKTEFVQQAGSRSSEWENIGPNNVGGRTISIAIDPVDTNIIYLGSAGGGLWKSTTGGIGVDAWQYMPTGYPVLGVGAIAINPADNNEIFIGTGETYSYGTATNGLITRTERGSFGIGILRSVDGGSTWDISLDWTYQENRGVWDIVFDPSDPSILFAATTEGIYKSDDGGATWIQKLDKKMVMDLDINSNDPQILFAGVGNLNSVDKGIYKSIDGGENWNIITGGGLPAYTQDGRISISHFPANPDILVTLIANAFSTKGIYKSVNGGTLWTALDAEEVASYQGWYAKANLIHATDANKILVGGVELYKSTNGGASLTQKTSYIGPASPMHPDIHDIISNPLDPDLIYIVTDGGLFRSNDFGESFYPCNDGYVTSQFYIGSMSSQTNDVGLGGLQDNFTQRYDGSKYWLALIGGDGCFNAIDFENDAIQYASYQYANFLKSYDQGFTFFEGIYSPIGAAAFTAPFILCPSDPEIIYTGDTKLHRSDDAGGFFSTPDPADADTGNVLLSIGVSTFTPDTVYFSAAGISGRADMYRSFDKGETVTAITNGLPDRYYRDIAVNKNNANELFICLSGFGTPHIYRSVNAGDTWTDVSATLPDVPFHSILIDPVNDSVIYAGNDFSVFVSFDKGNTWEAMNEGWPDAAPAFDLFVSPSDNQLVVCTHGHGVYRTDLLGVKVQPTQNDDLLSENHFAVYPKLVDDAITIVSNSEIHEKIQIELFDLNGNKILSLPFYGEEIKLNCGDLAAGNYFVCIYGNKIKQIERIVVK